MDPCPAPDGVKLQQRADGSGDERGLDNQNPVRLRQAGGTGDDDGWRDTADNHGDDVLQGQGQSFKEMRDAIHGKERGAPTV